MMRPTRSINPANWYWSVSGKANQVYSSAVGDYVPIDNPTYVSWLALGNSPTSIDTEANLGEVLSKYSVRPSASGVLDGYADAQTADLPPQVIMKILFSHESRIRAATGQPAINAAQFKAFVKGLI